MKNIIVGQSGGPTAVINSSLYGVVEEGLAQKETISHVYGMINGIQGFLQDKVMDMGQDLTKEQRQLLKVTPSAYLGSCRYKLPQDLKDPVYPLLFEKFEQYNIGYFLYIGGNDSMDTVSKLSNYARQIGSDIKFIGEPKTIDNDLVLTDHTPGFGSAAKYVATTVREIATDANVYEAKSVTIVEVMGRHAGWLTAASVLARKFKGDNPMFVYVPEVDFDIEDFLKKVQQCMEKHPTVTVCVSEGIHDKNGVLLCEYDSEAKLDSFGHKMLSGCGKYLENVVKDRLGVKARSVELNVSQRCSVGMMARTDQQEAIEAGRYGVKAAISGQTGKMVAYDRVSSAPYEIRLSLQDVNEICNKEKTVPLEWISDGKDDVTDDFVTYARPLIEGQVEPCIGEDGLPVFLYR